MAKGYQLSLLDVPKGLEIMIGKQCFKISDLTRITMVLTVWIPPVLA